MALQHRGALGARLDTLAIVQFFGGAEELSRALKAHKITTLTPYAIKQWCTRRHIPFLRRLDLLALAKAQNRSLSLSRFTTDTPKKKAAV